MKAAILLCGQMRSYKHPVVLQSLLLFFQQFDFDIFLSTWDEQGVSYNHGNILHHGDEHRCIEESDLRSIYPNVRAVSIHSLTSWEAGLSKTYKRIYTEGFTWNGGHIKGTVVPQLFTLWDANRLRKTYERETGQRYDVVIRCRPDVIFQPVPSLHWFPGSGISAINNPASGTFYPNRIYDIFFFGSSQAMDALCDAYNHLELLEAHPFQNGLHPRDACRILYVQALIHGIPVRDIPFDLCTVKR